MWGNWDIKTRSLRVWWLIAYRDKGVGKIKDDAKVSELGFEWMEVLFNKIGTTGLKTEFEEDYHFTAEVEVKGGVT